MNWQVLIAVVVAAPVILIPAIFVWYVNFKGASVKARQQLNEMSQPKAAPVTQPVEEKGG